MAKIVNPKIFQKSKVKKNHFKSNKSYGYECLATLRYMLLTTGGVHVWHMPLYDANFIFLLTALLFLSLPLYTTDLWH